jgi:hypothetical protein
MRKLDDITFYFSSTKKIPQTPDDWSFRKVANFVCDMFYYNLDGYKPPHTSRINIMLNENPSAAENSVCYFGSICLINAKIDEDKYLKNSLIENQFFLLEIIKSATDSASIEYNWDKSVFENAYKKTIALGFNFNITLHEKKKGDKVLKTIIEKDIHNSFLKIKLENKTITLIKKDNICCHDSIFSWGEKVKWFNTDEVGIELKKQQVKISYSISKDTLTSNIIFKEGNIFISK